MAKQDTTPTWEHGDIDRFTFFSDFWDSISEAPTDKQLTMFHAIMEYCFCGTEPNFGEAWELKAIWNTIRHRLYMSCMRTSVGRLGGKAGGAPKGNANAQKQNPPQERTNPAEATNITTAPASSEQGAGEAGSTSSLNTIPAEATVKPANDDAQKQNPPQERTNPAEATNVPTAPASSEQENIEELARLIQTFAKYWSIGRRNEADKKKEWNAWKTKGEEYRIAMMQFANWWIAYGKSADKQKCINLWLRLAPAERQRAIDATPAYVASTPNRQYRKDPYTWLYNKSWENDIIERTMGERQERTNPAEATETTDYKALKERLMQGKGVQGAGFPLSKYQQAKERMNQNTTDNDE